MREGDAAGADAETEAEIGRIRGSRTCAALNDAADTEMSGRGRRISGAGARPLCSAPSGDCRCRCMCVNQKNRVKQSRAE